MSKKISSKFNILKSQNDLYRQMDVKRLGHNLYNFFGCPTIF